MLPERMEDDGLVLRRWVLGDAEALDAVMAESASHLRPWVTWVDEEATSIEGRRVLIAEREREWQDGGSVLLGMSSASASPVGAASTSARTRLGSIGPMVWSLSSSRFGALSPKAKPVGRRHARAEGSFVGEITASCAPTYPPACPR
jgi:hypothetical protein